MTVYLAVTSAPGPDSASSSKSISARATTAARPVTPPTNCSVCASPAAPSRARMKPADRAAAPLRMNATRTVPGSAPTNSPADCPSVQPICGGCCAPGAPLSAGSTRRFSATVLSKRWYTAMSRSRNSLPALAIPTPARSVGRSTGGPEVRRSTIATPGLPIRATEPARLPMTPRARECDGPLVGIDRVGVPVVTAEDQRYGAATAGRGSLAGSVCGDGRMLVGLALNVIGWCWRSG